MRTRRATLEGDRAGVFKALGHPVRLQIVEVLEQDGEACVCHLEHRLGLRQAYLSQQLARLRSAGIVTDRRSGANVFYALSDDRVASMVSLVPTTGSSSTSYPAGRQRRARAACPCPRCNANLDAAARTPSPAERERGSGREGQAPHGQPRRSEAG